ncbi:hypothetical protein D9V32_14625 [Mycetocola tolaasinivorans]|uniref:Iron ABC transporter ATP-binding protein n=2 Tax=Mycetocola tolaasinivorans TaxID=76635 RepID=A0A3L6ZZ66_9MICO|nr:hypothetical protein D9V32_14625 [Mycetocola tolaasinivorans]
MSLPRSARRASLFALATAGLLLVTACAPSAGSDPSAPASAPASASADATPDRPDASATPGGEASPGSSTAPSGSATPDAPELESGVVPITCAQLLTPETVYAYNPNVSATSGAPAAGGTAERITNIGGIHCQLTNNSSNTVIDVAVASLDAATIEDLKNEAAETSQQVPTYTALPDEGYFGPKLLKNGKRVNEAQIFVGNYWIVFASEEFTEPGAIEMLSTPAIAALKAAKL